MSKRWIYDPYDKSFTKGLLMNLSEDRRFDAEFPEQSLTEVRIFADFIIGNN